MLIIFFAIIIILVVKLVEIQTKIEIREEELKRKKRLWDLYAGQTV